MDIVAVPHSLPDGQQVVEEEGDERRALKLYLAVGLHDLVTQGAFILGEHPNSGLKDFSRDADLDQVLNDLNGDELRSG